MSRLPTDLREQVSEWLSDYLEVGELPDSELLRQSLPAVWACSPFVARSCLRDHTLLEGLVASGDLETAYEPDTLHDALLTQTRDIEDEQALDRELRRIRNREMVRIAWRDLAGWVSLDETLHDLSRLAEACIDAAVAWHEKPLQQRFGVPRGPNGEESRFYVVGMGKLGGEELNYSSDIDLIFGYSQPGHTDGEKSRDNTQYFMKLGQKVINSLNAQTVDGFVFRVDMRLRPYGDSGPLVMTTDQIEAYYESQGREWERYAMVKARVVGGDRAAGEELMDALVPFVFRRYLDFGALESLREMKAMIAKEVERKGLESNIKLGAGGIREVEFIAQAFQIIRGGREKELQQRRLMPVLESLAESGGLPGFVIRGLMEGYEFLRRSENRLQAIKDEQTHELPDKPIHRMRLAFGMGYENWEDYTADLDVHRRHVREHFDQVFASPQVEDEPVPHEILEVGDIWARDLDQDKACELLTDNGFENATDAFKRVNTFREGSHCRSLTDTGHQRLDRLMPLLLGAVAHTKNPDATLARLIDLLEAIVRRTVYVSLLAERPMALSQLVKLCSASPWIARLITRLPVLLGELLDPRKLYAPLERKALEQQLRERLDEEDPDDLEQQMEVLRQFKQVNTLRLAAADVSGVTRLMVVSDLLTDIAEVVLREVVDIAWHHLEKRHGRPSCKVDGETVRPGFAVIAYGKLGGLELGYGSDLDLVFLHDSRGEQQMTDGDRAVDNNVFFVRLAQRIIHILGATTAGGVLYEVDTRLRPSGRAGLLATSLSAYEEYQQDKAWTWEHQALVRARFVAGDAALQEAFDRIRREILCRERDLETLRGDVHDMRERMRGEKGNRDADLFDLKQDRGGVADIEFMVQYGVLSKASANPTLLRYTDNVRLIGELAAAGFFSRSEASTLADAYRAYRARIHRATLQEGQARIPATELAELRDGVSAVWQRLMTDDETAADTAGEETRS
ncbi:bifunctional [glutamate--ammonia ligase]-adenylyl-L-tyrosine phosphorylase/[glutamate--ammonia-ligase] adenylyltransferase [Methylonatrum kenyense]|uniref:bifunctional [glutamate--ammonia ligase]-adenylyl-L-tyrosine phosphorylase/[glutamate--ammonia-ligase] adenylyltransferase n=1 Tax=Methylonatrum kenyense TaxID=455253 RepID=UPI0020BDA02A|nr:bifunctional [glutamate--ammonia ligase]-adenylyl-L-tyrosine phosphorylase/[glutamate--ammonia-ligase] adenylyltransferase [Methylonatrum kenyense]MCK8516985.1 bifunctional [glutamate--ammonia ligase]-adenylyl-L-tyrosine phosphorylase/[glutamate--ammonia-ligase] adenylyltransferase [Methylonatrum kenyense]